ncbi:hypothetical protein ONS95_007150 [Cadophora gregata]|uniref:uncharacterized protein n=1 Tax=Cadophora gregata TaxID=51156 RepID=UPI0026DB4827|nr:uncharacterized protein ONS95_007150 [Cadophora gregata]KAK0100698.1 hypothetical protein ONS95_007150 [Cadophora gregata]KAK0117305.1 hypothetical protein ONS96_013137 [Cadophora gregata f. sp. sojae]
MHRPHRFDPPWIDFFTRPCPWFTKQLKTFPQFSRLPRELQLTIWEFAVPCRQIVCLSYPASLSDNDDDFSEEPFEIRLRYSRPGMLRACYDARVAGLRHFTPAFKSYLPSPVRFNFDRDYMELNIEMVEWIAHTHREKQSPLIETPLVKNLAVSVPRQLTAEDVVLICRYFTGLESLLINEAELDRSRPAAGYPCTFSPKAANFIARHRWGELRRIIMRPKLEKWVPPVLIIGTDTQWAWHALNFSWVVCRPVDHVDSMDWQPTITTPSLEYVPRLAAVSGPSSALTVPNDTTTDRLLEEYVQEHYNIRSWVFEDISIRFRVLDAKSGLDFEKDWPGRR